MRVATVISLLGMALSCCSVRKYVSKVNRDQFSPVTSIIHLAIAKEMMIVVVMNHNRW